MANAIDDENFSELLEYDDDTTADKNANVDGVDTQVKRDVKGTYVSIHTSGFRDLLLKPEILRAIKDFGFEHPSEGEFSDNLSHNY